MTEVDDLSARARMPVEIQRMSVLEFTTAEGEPEKGFLFQFSIAADVEGDIQNYVVQLNSDSSKGSTSSSAVWSVAEEIGDRVESQILAGKSITLSALTGLVDDSLAKVVGDEREAGRQDAFVNIRDQLEQNLADSSQGTGPRRVDWLDAVPRVMRSRSWPDVDIWTVESPSPNVYEQSEVPNLRGVGLDSHLLERESLAYGLTSFRYGINSLVVKDRHTGLIPFHFSGSTVTGEVARRLVNDKEATRVLLESAGVPVPRGRAFPLRAINEATRFAESLGWPVVVKPADGRHGTAVTLDVCSPDALQAAFKEVGAAPASYSTAIVEEQVDGGNYRVFVAGGKVVSAVLARHGSVVGTGRHAVAELILKKISLRSSNPHLRSRRIEVSDTTVQRLAEQDLTLDTVLPRGEKAVFTPTVLFRGGGESVEVLDEMHPSIIRVAERALEAIPELGFTGLDFLIPDHRVALREQRAAICEINAHPSLASGLYPMYGPSRDVPKVALQHVAEQAGVELDPRPASTLSLFLRVDGGRIEHTRAERYARWAKGRRVDGSIIVDAKGADIVLSGEAHSVASLTNAAYNGLGKTETRTVEVSHTQCPPSGFHVGNTEES